VTITRRVFRSGESEYLLNKVPCRLKDILDLFMDTGMGSDAYSVIELKMVETILSDKADERRRLFEEAAGVTKYKYRRKAAYRKLESVQQDLTRVNDIVKEVQKTVNSLERQAKKAEQYNDVSTRLKALEIDLLEREYAYLHGKLLPLEEKFVLARADRSQIDAALNSQEERIDRLRSGLQQTEEQLSEAQKAEATHLETIHRIEEKILIANERRNSLNLNIERYENEKSDLYTQRGILSQEKISLAAREHALGSDIIVSSKEYVRAKDELEKLSQQVGLKKIEVQSFKDTILNLAHEIVQKRGEQERLKARIDNLKGRIERSVEDNILYQSDVKQNEERVTRLTSEDRELRRRFAVAEIQLDEREQFRRRVKEEADTLQQKSLEVKNGIDRTLSRIDFLRRLVESNEGYSEGARYLLSDERWKKKKLETIADLIEVPETYRGAIEAVLGDVANYLVFDRMEDAYAAIDELKKSNKGKVTFICKEWVPKSRRIGAMMTNVSSRRARDIVKCEETYRPLINFLLDDVVIAESLKQANEILSRQVGIRCVTPNGQIITSSGVIRGGSQRLDEGGLIGKKSQITELEQIVARLRDELNAINLRHTEKVNEYDTMELKSYTEAVKNIEREMTAIEMRIAQIEFEKKRANEGIERNNVEIVSLEKEIQELQHGYESVVGELTIIEQKKTELDVQANTAIRELEILEIQWDEKSRVVNELEIKVVTLQGDLRNVERDIERAAARIEDIEVTLVRRDEEILRARDEIGRLAEEIDVQNKSLGALSSGFEIVEQRKQEIEQRYANERNELHRIELKLKDERRLHDDAVTVAHELEIKISELKSNIEHLKLRAQEEFELALQLKTYPEDEWVDFAQRREEVKSMKERIRILGAINFAAFDEFTTEGERLTFLTQQRDDLLEAEKTLLSTIEEINSTAQRKFLETFGKIRENFITTFKELFQEGDECDLKLEEGIDPLEANIEIIAKPRGKRPTSIDLLSGGEKTLTAIALLFAIYLVKPSPFCILDEVDAPLDDSNIDRYTRILKKFSDNTQFIVVTHNKRTMEAAIALYGVTMEEEGVSKIVTVRFNEEARVRSATVATGA
jgi:chromosome segregation protein